MEWKAAKKILLKNHPMLKTELDRLETRYQIIRQIIELRKKNRITQLELANKINDKQSNIARLENGNANPSIEKLCRIAEGLNSCLQIRFIPKVS